MTALAKTFADHAWQALGGESSSQAVSFTGEGALPSAFPVTDLASASVAVAGLAVAELVAHHTGARPSVAVDRRLASMWFALSVRPVGWDLPALWDPIAGDYQARDGWIRLHTNAPHHKKAAQQVIGMHETKASVAEAVARWNKGDLEKAIVEAGGCAAEMRSLKEWLEHPQGVAVARESLIHATEEGGGAPNWTAPRDRPLAGIRVLDLTRVLAGPVASRFLAGYGADVLRIDPYGWDEPGVELEVTLGKRCARLDLRKPQDRAIFESLLRKADVFLHGYRPGALENLGYGAETRRNISPGLIDVCLNAYGWSGPWAGRRGFDSLVQMSAGIAEAGMAWRQAEKPTPLPVQALDHATGYLMAAAVVRGLTERLARNRGCEARLSLARTAKLLADYRSEWSEEAPLAPETAADLSPTPELTSWGEARRLTPPLIVDGAPMRWNLPARRLGTDAPAWNAE